MKDGIRNAELTFVAVQAAGRQAHGLSEVDDGLLNAAHVPQRRALQEQRLHAVAVELDGLGPQVEGPGVALAVEAVAAETADAHVGVHTHLERQRRLRVLQTHPEMTQGSACWSDILNNRPPRTSTSSRCPSRAIRYPYTSIPGVETSELKAQLGFNSSSFLRLNNDL